MELLPGIIIILLGMVGLVLAFIAIDLIDEFVRYIAKKWRKRHGRAQDVCKDNNRF